MRKLGAIAMLLLVACGKRGDPRPPVPVIPKATSDLVVTQQGSKVILTWSYPSLSTAGQSLHEIRRIVVYRATEELPVPQGGRDPLTIQPGDVDPTAPRELSLFSHVPLLSPTQFLRLRDRLDSIESANLPAATAGAKLLYEDSPDFRTKDGRPVRLTYSVTTETATTRGDLSNLAHIVPLVVPHAPSDLTATPKPAGVVLAWTKPESSTSGSSKPFIAGYNVYRSPSNQQPDAIPVAINTAPITTTTYTDVPAYGSYTYSVRAVVAAGPPRIESDPSSAVNATFRDLVPPPPVTNLNALVETKTVRLIWDPVAAADLAGYRIYRTEGTGAPLHPVAPALLFTPSAITATNWIDAHVDPGISYFYEVTSIDKSGNESARVKTDWVLVPKTP